ncbi:GNAT family N-acetyltransferase [Kordia sp.]|uniref:GNAT family N-acetyltransferase n=1 Tax=Kordia sp. TaxID=1965332 RepID=UPI003B58D13F
MNTNTFPEIQTERLLLRRLQVSDWEVVSYIRSDKKMNEFIKRPIDPSKEAALKFITRINNNIDTNTVYHWVITKQNDPKMIGSICLWNFSEDKKTAEVGYDLSTAFQGKGIMNETLKTILEFGFHTLQLDTIEAYTDRRNESSKRLLEKNQFSIVLGKKDSDNEDNIVYEIKNNMR